MVKETSVKQTECCMNRDVEMLRKQ